MVVTIILAGLLVGAVVLLLRKRKECPTPPTCPEEDKSGFLVTFIIDNTKITGKNMALSAFPQQRTPFELTPVDRKGNPAQVEAGTVVFSVADTAIAEVQVDPTNELRGVIITKTTGVTQLNYSADADLGAGVTTISGFDAIEVKAEQAVGFGITFGPSEDIEETP
jgi:hypothetical protein